MRSPIQGLIAWPDDEMVQHAFLSCFASYMCFSSLVSRLPRAVKTGGPFIRTDDRPNPLVPHPVLRLPRRSAFSRAGGPATHPHSFVSPGSPKAVPAGLRMVE